jgi:mitochondrial fission protein ELM1
VLVVSDGVPGHDRSSFGILSALRKFRKVEAVLLPVEEVRRGRRRIRRTLARLMPFDSFWRGYYSVGERGALANPLALVRALPAGPIDLVISAGPATAAANIALARRYAAKNVYFGFPQWPITGAFTLLLTPALGGVRRNVAHVLRPSDLDASDLPAPRPLAVDAEVRCAALLFGGDTKHYRYTVQDLQLLAARLADLVRDLPRLRWTVFDSRRTPAEPFDHFVEATAPIRSSVEVVRFAEGGLLSNMAAFRSDLVLVTADSMSMIAEAIAARRPTVILFADDYRAPKRDKVEHDLVIARRWAFPLRFSDLEASAFLTALPRVVPMSELQLDGLHATMSRFGI